MDGCGTGIDLHLHRGLIDLPGTRMAPSATRAGISATRFAVQAVCFKGRAPPYTQPGLQKDKVSQTGREHAR
jgi:hypothetical protein